MQSRHATPHQATEELADKGVQIIGVSREKSSKVEEFLAKPEWDKKTGYTIALDSEDKTNTAYMKAAGQNGIPCAFVVGKDGHVEWIGHPATMDKPLEMIVAGEWDRDSFKEKFSRQQAENMKATRAEKRTSKPNGVVTTARSLPFLIENSPRILATATTSFKNSSSWSVQ